jgi:hypothetical protein
MEVVLREWDFTSRRRESRCEGSDCSVPHEQQLNCEAGLSFVPVKQWAGVLSASWSIRAPLPDDETMTNKSALYWCDWRR